MAEPTINTPHQLSDLVCLLRDLQKGKPIQDGLFATMKANGLVAGQAAAPILTGRGLAMLRAKVDRSSTLGAPTVHMPDVLDRLVNPRKGEATLLAQHDGAAAMRFQRDLEKSGLRQRTSQSWSYASLVLKTNKRSMGTRPNEPVAALDAKERVRKACCAVGPDLSGLLIDICLYDKTLACIEKERGWPARSGKLAVALGLKALARHYGLDQVARGAEAKSHKKTV